MRLFYSKSTNTDSTNTETTAQMELDHHRANVGGKNPSALFTGENCVDSTRIRSFLTLSRIADDTFKTHMNGDCDYFTKKVLPEWNMRARLIEFCGNYAKSIRKETSLEDKEFDLRTDPYALRDYKEQVEAKNAVAATVESWVHNEETVEGIVREGTLKIMKEKCWEV